MTRKYGLLGHPLGHSFSRQFHNDRFAQLGIDAEYVNYDLEDISQLPEVLSKEKDLCGLNVTIPYKQQVIQLLDELDLIAERIGAVNTICIRRGLKAGHLPGLWLKGYNTDIIGFRDSISPLLQASNITAGDSALILGTGGASQAIRVALEDMGIAHTYVSRKHMPGTLSYDELTPEVMNCHRVIVNCTPLGMFPKVDTCPPIPYHLLTSGHVCYDLVYNPEDTLFLSKARQYGAQTMGGLSMLKLQAVASYNYWIKESDSE